MPIFPRLEPGISFWSYVHINQSDSVHAYGDSATYDGNARIARLYQNVRLTDRAMILTTDFLTYDMENRIGNILMAANCATRKQC